MRIARSIVPVAALALSAVALASPVAHASNVYDNCTSLNHKYPHGVGRSGARDHTSGTPVTTFKVSTKLYNQAMKANSDLDRDRDGIACEKS